MRKLAGTTVLLLEDEYLIAMDAEEILKNLRVERVVTVSTLADAQKAVETDRFDLALLDVNINGEMSFPVAEALRKSGVPVVFASGYELKDRPPADVELGPCIGKPYTAASLKEALSQALNASP